MSGDLGTVNNDFAHTCRGRSASVVMFEGSSEGWRESSRVTVKLPTAADAVVPLASQAAAVLGRQGPEPRTQNSDMKVMSRRRSWTASLLAAFKWPRINGSRASSSQVWHLQRSFPVAMHANRRCYPAYLLVCLDGALTDANAGKGLLETQQWSCM